MVRKTYFIVTYPDASRISPIVVAYRFLGKNPRGVEEVEPGSHYYFQLLPAFPLDGTDGADRITADDWLEVRSLGSEAGSYGRPIQSVKLLGHDGELQWKQEPDGLVISCPATMPFATSVVFRID